MSLLGLSSYYLTHFDRPINSFLHDLNHHHLHVGEIVDYRSTTLNKHVSGILKNMDDIKFMIHGSLDTENDICSPDASVRRAALRRLEQSIDYSVDIGAVAFVQHPALKNSEIKNGWQLNCDALLTLLDYGNSRGIKVLVENMATQRSYMSTTSEFIEFINANNVNLKMVFDTGHAHIAGNTDEFIQRLASHFFMVHISDNDGTNDAHLNVGEGTIDWNKLVLSLKQRLSGMYVIEAIKEPIKSVQAIRALLK